MPDPPALSVTFDHEQNRYIRDRIGVTLGGADLSASQYRNDTYVVPIDGSVILRPRPDYAAWGTSSTSPYNKLTAADFGSPAGINEVDTSGTGVLKHLNGVANISLLTSSTYLKNQPWYISGFSFSNGTDGVLLEFGWNSSATLASGTGVRVYNSGRAVMYRDGVQIGEGTVNGKEGPGQSQNTELGLYAVPCRGREIMIWTTQGGGFTVVMPDIDEGAADPEIVPVSKFWVIQPDVSTSILVAPLKFATTGTSCSELYKLAEAPDGTDTFEQSDNRTEFGGAAQEYYIWGEQSHVGSNTDAGSASLVMPDGSTAFDNDGTNYECRIKTSLSGNGTSTPFVYGVAIAYATLPEDTDDSEEYDATSSLFHASLSVPDGSDGETFHAEFVYDTDLETNVDRVLTMYNRPLLVKLGSIHILNGRTSAAEYERMYLEEAQRISFDIQTTIKALKAYVFRERMPFDGMYLSRETDDCVIRRVMHLIGIPDGALELEDSDVRIGDIAPKTCGEWSELAEVGSSAWEVISRNMDDALSGWHYGNKPTATGIKFVTVSPATIAAAASLVELYWTTADAITAGHSAADAWRYVIRRHNPHIVESESNEVVITGQDLRTGLLLGSVKRDLSAQNPTLAPSARPDNWKGEICRTGITNRGINNQDMSDGAAVLVSERLFPTRYLDDFESEFMLANETTGLPIWRGDKITLDGNDRIIQSFEASFEKEPETGDAWRWRNTRYCASNVMGSTGAVRAIEIAREERRRSEFRNVQRRNSAIGGVRRASLVQA